MINAQIRQFRDSLIAITNASPLPIEIKRLVFQEVYTSVSNEADKIILKENAQKEHESQTDKKESEVNDND